jgi:hypothetical protein
MSADIRFNLMIQVLTARGRKTPFVSVVVHVWQDEKHIETINLVEYEDFEWPEGASLSTVENTAAVGARVAARMLEDVQFNAITDVKLHHRRDYEASAASGYENGVSM